MQTASVWRSLKFVVWGRVDMYHLRVLNLDQFINLLFGKELTQYSMTKF